jgi:hypothetical protein
MKKSFATQRTTFSFFPEKPLVTPAKHCFTPPMVAARFISFAPGRWPAPRPAGRTLHAALAKSRRAGPDQRLPQRGQQPRYARRPATSGPRPPIHAHQKSPRRERRPKQQNLELFISSIIFDRNSQVCLHNYRQTQPFTKINRARSPCTNCWLII